MSIFLAGGVTPPAAPSWIIGWKQPSSSFTPEYWVDRSGQRFPFAVAVAVTTPFFVYQTEPRKWIEPEAFRSQEQSFRPFFVQAGLSLQARLETKRRDVEPEIDVRRDTRFPFPAVVTQATPFFVYQSDTRRWNWETPLPTQETLRFPFQTVVVQSTPFFVYQSPQRTWFETNELVRKADEFRPFFTQNGLNLPLQVEKWSRIEAEGQPRQYDGWGAYRPFWTAPPVPTGWTSAFSVEKWHRIEAEPFRRVSENGWDAFRPFAPYGGHCAFNPYAFSEAFASCRPHCAFNAIAFSPAFASCRDAQGEGGNGWGSGGGEHHGYDLDDAKRRHKRTKKEAAQLRNIYRRLQGLPEIAEQADEAVKDVPRIAPPNASRRVAIPTEIDWQLADDLVETRLLLLDILRKQAEDDDEETSLLLLL
jgi:hypothetical protein